MLQHPSDLTRGLVEAREGSERKIIDLTTTQSMV
jgi:hypothetical protein